MLELRLAGQTPPVTARTGPAWLALGFRPFFLLAALHAAVMVWVWLGVFLGGWSLSTQIPPLTWHAHEMLFGFAGAAVAGFLLTAVPNWTGLPTPRGAPLGALAALWVLGRVALLGNWLPGSVAALLDLAFLPTLASALASPLVRARQWKNLVFLPILGLLSLADVLVWADRAQLGLELGLTCILLLVAIIGGRVIPFFIRAALGDYDLRSRPWVEKLAPAWLLLLFVSEQAGLTSGAVAVLYLLGALLHGLRLAGWYDRRLWRVPLLWILFLGYGWLVVGLALKAQALGWGLNPRPALHALTAGCIGSLILGMMARVALGHSGRALKPAPLTVLAFILVTLAAGVRCLGPLLAPTHYTTWLSASATLWSLAYGLYAMVYAPILTTPRADGRPG